MHIPKDELASLVTAQEITDAEIDRARGVTIEVRAGTFGLIKWKSPD